MALSHIKKKKGEKKVSLLLSRCLVLCHHFEILLSCSLSRIVEGLTEMNGQGKLGNENEVTGVWQPMYAFKHGANEL